MPNKCQVFFVSMVPERLCGGLLFKFMMYLCVVPPFVQVEDFQFKPVGS